MNSIPTAAKFSDNQLANGAATPDKPAILMLTPYLPYPPISGGRTRTYNLIAQLAGEFAFTVVCFGRPEEQTFDLAPMRDLCELIVIDRAASPGKVRAALLSVGSLRPITMRLYTNDAMRSTVADLINARNFDAIHVESFYMMQNLPENPGAPVLLSEPSIEYVAWGRYARVAQPIYQRPALAIESIKMRAFEPSAWRQADQVGVMSATDAGFVHARAPEVTTVETPNGVDIDFFTDERLNRDRARAVYMGDYKYFPNTEAVGYFLDQIMPLIRAELPDFKLALIGKEPPAVFAEKARDPSSGLSVAGLVPDTRPYLGSAGVFICPQRSGGGTRFKLMESMACGCPVVATTLGAEGLGAVDGEHLLIADTPRAFADAILRVLRDPELADRLGRAGRDLVVNRHSWRNSADRVRAVYRTLSKTGL